MFQKIDAGGIEGIMEIMAAAGVCKHPDPTLKLLQIAPVVSGTYTPQPRSGNEGKTQYPDTLDEYLELGYGLNAWGMPNPGFDAAARAFAGYEGDEPLIISIAGETVDEYVEGVDLFSAIPGVSAIELNLGCPNTGKRIASFDLTFIRNVLQVLGSLDAQEGKPIWVKLSPYADPYMLGEVARTLRDFQDVVAAVVTCNTFPNAYHPDSGIAFNGGLAGLSGPALRPIALGQVVQFVRALKGTTIDVIGVGGIASYEDVFAFLKAGAVAVQVNSRTSWGGDLKDFWDPLIRDGEGRILPFDEATED